jgi:DNA-binding NtrC family response regulator
MIGESAAMRRVYTQIQKVATLDVPVLISGESGTGKELVAASVHARSLRASGPFVAVHTGAIVRDLIASELFGHEKGAFTGASYQRKGTFETADGGTLFLDEVSTMDEKTQVSLLRVLETHSFQRVGGKETITSDVRIVAATNQSLRDSIRRGDFREDLYHRLNVFGIRLPPLRNRREDIAPLARGFLRRYSRQFGKEVTSIEPEALALLRRYDWPGNVRELENVIMRAIIMAQDRIRAEDLPSELRESEPPRSRIVLEVGTTLTEMERELVLKTLQSVQGSKSAAARMLGVSRKTLYNKLRRHGLSDERFGDGD